MLDQLKQIGEEVHSRNFTGIVRENLTAGGDDFAVHRSYNNHTLPKRQRIDLLVHQKAVS